MKRSDLKQRLDILIASSVISKKSADITILAYIHLQDHLKLENIKQAEMLFTHLPTALTRIEKGEKVAPPLLELLEEVKQSPYSAEALKEINYVKAQWNEALPQEELDYLLIHYTNVLQINKGGIY